MDEIKDIYRHIASLQEQIATLSKQISEIATTLSTLGQSAHLHFEQTNRHNSLIDNMRKDMDTLKAETRKQGESLAFLERSVSS